MQNHSKDSILKDKQRLFKKYTNFNQNSTILGFYEIAKMR